MAGLRTDRLRGAATRRRAGCVVAGLILALLTMFPRPFVARGVILLDPALVARSTGRFGALGARSMARAILADGANPVRVAALVARSGAVDDAARSLSGGAAVEVHMLDGGMIEMLATGTDPATLRQAVAARMAATLARLDLLAMPARIVDPARIDDGRGYNPLPAALLGLLALFAFFMEFLVPTNSFSTRAAWGEA